MMVSGVVLAKREYNFPSRSLLGFDMVFRFVTPKADVRADSRMNDKRRAWPWRFLVSDDWLEY
jgi:hypothetical protein